MKQALSLAEYISEVVKKAHEQYGKAVCTDCIEEYYELGESIESCVEQVLVESYMWDDSPF